MVQVDSDIARLEVVREAIASRANRTKFLPTHLFADPAWDMLLDLYHSNLVQRRVTISSLCIASNVPATTALRWIKALEGDGLASREADPFNARRYYIALTERGLTALKEFFFNPPTGRTTQTPTTTLGAIEFAVRKWKARCAFSRPSRDLFNRARLVAR